MGVVIWSNGRLHGPEDLLLSGVDHGLTVGDGVFETCAVYDGTAFALTRHLRRLERSALGLGLAAPDEGAVREGVARGARGRGSRRRSPADHAHGRAGTAGLAPVRARGPAAEHPRARRPRSAVRGLPGGPRAVGAQRAVVGGRPEDDVLRGERRGRRGGVPARRRRGRAGQHGRRAVRGHRVERLRRARRRAGDAAAVERLPGRHHARAAAGVVGGRRVSRSARPRRASSGTRCSTRSPTGRRT